MPRSLTAFLAALVVVVYFGFEVFSLHRLKYRTDPLYIYGEYAGARAATALCGTPEPVVAQRFERNFLHVTQRARAHVRDDDRPPGAPGPQEYVEQLQAQRSDTVRQLVQREGCDSPQVWPLLRLYEVRSRLNLHPTTEDAPPQ